MLPVVAQFSVLFAIDVVAIVSVAGCAFFCCSVYLFAVGVGAFCFHSGCCCIALETFLTNQSWRAVGEGILFLHVRVLKVWIASIVPA